MLANGKHMGFIKENSVGDFRVMYENLPEHQCLGVKFYGTFDARCSDMLNSEGADLMNEYDYTRCLIDISECNYKLSIIDMYSRAEVWDKNNMPRTCRIAYLTAPDNTPENLEFLDNVLSNRGWVIKRFKDRNKALEWLESSRSEESS